MQRAASPEEVQQALSQRNTSESQLQSAKANVDQQKLPPTAPETAMAGAQTVTAAGRPLW
jgi:hypothetical protein